MSLKRNFYELYIFFNAAKRLTSNMYNIYTKESILDKLIMAEMLWKNMLVCAALEDQYVKSEVYKVFISKIFKKSICVM